LVSPDILALEECDHFSDWFHPHLGEDGFDGIFYPKPGEPQRDGTALFWQRSKFRKVNQNYTQYGSDTQGVVIVHLEHVDREGSGLCVAATHLKAKPGFEKKRETQGVILLEAVAKFNEAKHWPIIILGDFNDVPDSLVAQVLKQSKTSAYPDSPNDWTTWKKRESAVKRIIDYIWYEPQKLTLTHRLSIPPDSACPVMLPASYYPSDHILIAAKFTKKSSL